MGYCKLEVLKQSINGKIFKCLTCKKIHIEYKNLNFTFTEEEFNFFRDYFLNLNPEKWERANEHTFYNRKIMVPIGHRNFKAMFNKKEVYELKRMFKDFTQGPSDFDFIDTDKIDACPSLN